MPPKKGKICYCQVCGAGGQFIPSSLQKNHDIRIAQIEAQQSNIEPSSGDLVSQIFSLTFTDNGSRPDRLFTSRNEYQSDLLNITTGSPPLPIDEIMESIERIESRQGLPSTSTIAAPASTQMERLKATKASKAERNILTAKAHATLNHINKHLDRLSRILSSQSPSLQTVEEADKSIQDLAKALAGLTRKTQSVQIRKESTGERLSALEARLSVCRAQHPSPTRPVEYDTSHHFDAQINNMLPVTQVTMFLAVVCTVMMGVSRRLGDFIMKMLAVNLRVAFQQTSITDGLSPLQHTILNGLPKTVETALSNFDLEAKTTVYAVCEECHCTYAPTSTHDSKIPSYPKTCTNVPAPGEEVCQAPLLHKSRSVDGTTSYKPIKTFVYHHFHDYLAGLLSRKDIEILMDKPCDDLMGSVRDHEPPPQFVTDIFDGEFLRTFEGPIPGKLFVDRPGNEGRYVFALSYDSFRTEGMKISGAQASSALISAACLNLPLSIRYNPENMYVGIIPGPKGPKDDQINHYIRPIVDDLLVSWERGVRYSCTACHPKGRDTRSAIALCVCDLPAGREISQTGRTGSNHYCSVCNCRGVFTPNRHDFDHEDWLHKDGRDQRMKSEQYRDASTIQERDILVKKNGTRWSQLWRLPYWDPVRMLAIDPMHCLLEGVAHFHFRHVLGLTETAVEESRKQKVKLPTFEYVFPVPTNEDIANFGLSKSDQKFIPQIHRNLVEQIKSDNDKTIADGLSGLMKRLMAKNLQSLAYVSESLGAEPDIGGDIRVDNILRKADYCRGLVNWRIQFQLYTPDEHTSSYRSHSVMRRIRDVIRSTDTPTWLPSVPYNFGTVSAGTLKADEWRTLTTVYLPMSLVSVWGEGTNHQSPAQATKLRNILDHTMALVSAVSIACMRVMTQYRMQAYQDNIRQWLRDIENLHGPVIGKKVNGHMAIHISHFLVLFGPVRSWWTFPFERLIGKLQRIPHNHLLGGQLESTMLAAYTRAANLRRWISRPDCPQFLRECQTIFSKTFGGTILGDDDDNDSAEINTIPLSPTPDPLRHLISEDNVSLPARYHHDGVWFSRSSTHVGNSLVMFYPSGKAGGELIPGSIEYIIVNSQNDVAFAVRTQLPASEETTDPFRFYPHYPAKVYSASLSPTLTIIKPASVLSHYARWQMDEFRVVVLTLSRD